MNRRLLLVPFCLALGGCATVLPPVEVTRFHTPALAALAPGSSFRFADGPDPDRADPERSAYRAAVAVELQQLGFRAASGNEPAALLIRVDHARTERQAQGASPVSVGVGGSTGSFGSGLGVGIGFNLGGGPRRWVDLALAVRIDDAASGTALWEGRSGTAVPAKSPGAQGSLAAAKLADALFRDFPGESGRTITLP